MIELCHSKVPVDFTIAKKYTSLIKMADQMD
jgi:hypothetical protein